MPTFMARWNTELPGCSGHAHQSLWDAATGASTFFDPDDEHGMSAEFRSYLAGIVALLPDLLAVFAPTVNSYKRLVEGFWAPTSATWGIDNRTVAARVIPGSASSTRLELRVPGSDVNPYLAVAASLGAGLWGIEQGLELEQPPTTGSGYADATAAPFAGNLLDATRQLDASAGARAVLGDGFVDHFVATRTWEWRRHADAVTDWELRRYFEII
jgi:glutamine synthetase